jgi:hypothetical protein
MFKEKTIVPEEGATFFMAFSNIHILGMIIFRCAAPVFLCWFVATNMGGALHLCDHIAKMRENKKSKKNMRPLRGRTSW